MNKNYYISNSSEIPKEIENQKLLSERFADMNVIKNYFMSELFGSDSMLVEYYRNNINLLKYSADPNVDLTKMSFFQRINYEQKKKKMISEAEKKEKIIKETMDSVQRHSNTILNLCDKYDLNLDGSFKDASRFEKIMYQLAEVGDINAKKEFFNQLTEIKQELANAYSLLKQSVGSLYTHEVYYRQHGGISMFSYDDLFHSTNEKGTLLDQILNEKIATLGQGLGNDKSFDPNEDFNLISINIARNVYTAYREIDFLKNSGYLQENELRLLTDVEKSYNAVAISENKLRYIKELIASLSYDPRFAKTTEMLMKQELSEKEEHNKLLNEAQDKYNKYDIAASMELVRQRKKNAAAMGDSKAAIEQAKKGDDEVLLVSNEMKLQKNKAENIELRKRTIMAQYLREKAFKTPDGKLKFSQYVEKYADVYGIDAMNKEDLVEEMVSRNGRKL